MQLVARPEGWELSGLARAGLPFKSPSADSSASALPAFGDTLTWLRPRRSSNLFCVAHLAWLRAQRQLLSLRDSSLEILQPPAATPQTPTL